MALLLCFKPLLLPLQPILLPASVLPAGPVTKRSTSHRLSHALLWPKCSTHCCLTEHGHNPQAQPGLSPAQGRWGMGRVGRLGSWACPALPAGRQKARWYCLGWPWTADYNDSSICLRRLGLSNGAGCTLKISSWAT